MNFTRKKIIDELENINEQEKNIVTKDSDVKNNWKLLKVKQSPWYIACEICLFILVCMIGFEIALLIDPTGIWHPAATGNKGKAEADLYSMIFSLIMTFWTLAVYIVLIYMGKETVGFNTVAFKNNTVYKQRSHIYKKSYWLSNFALLVLIVDFFLFYGFVGLMTSNDKDYYASLSAILSVLSIIVPAAAVPLGMQYINKHNAERKVETKYHTWIKLNAQSKYNMLKKINFANKVDYEQVCKDLEMDPDILVFDNKSTGDIKKNIILYNNIQLETMRDALASYSMNLDTRTELYKNIKWKRSKKTGKIILNKTLRNTNTINKIKKINKRNLILVDVIFYYYHEKFDA